MAEKKKKADVDEVAEIAQADQFMNVADWPLYRPKAIFRVKEIEGKPGMLVIVNEQKVASEISEADLLAEFEPVKGPHKREF